MITVEEREAIRRAYYLEGKVRGRLPANKAIPAKPLIRRSTISRPALPTQQTESQHQCSVPFRHAPTNCWPKMRICRASSSTPATKSMKCSRRRATRAVRRGSACIDPMEQATKPRPSFCHWSLNLVRMPKSIGVRPSRSSPGSGKRCRSLSCGFLQPTALCHGLSQPEARELLLRACLRLCALWRGALAHQLR